MAFSPSSAVCAPPTSTTFTPDSGSGYFTSGFAAPQIAISSSPRLASRELVDLFDRIDKFPRDIEAQDICIEDILRSGVNHEEAKDSGVITEESKDALFEDLILIGENLQESWQTALIDINNKEMALTVIFDNNSMDVEDNGRDLEESQRFLMQVLEEKRALIIEIQRLQKNHQSMIQFYENKRATDRVLHSSARPIHSNREMERIEVIGEIMCSYARLLISTGDAVEGSFVFEKKMEMKSASLRAIGHTAKGTILISIFIFIFIFLVLLIWFTI